MADMDLEITSKENPLYKELKKISKGKSDYIFIEGKKLFLEAIKSPVKIEKVYVDKKNKELLSEFSLNDCVFMDNNLLSSVFTTDNEPTGDDLIIALAKKPICQLSDLFKTKKSLVFLEHIQDPGNLGTIFRSAVAFDSGGIILTEDSVDPFNTKVIRASAGAIFKMPTVFIKNIEDLKILTKQEKYKIIATSSHKGEILNGLSLDSRSVFVFGNEGAGISKELLNLADETIIIPGSSNVESLNLGVAASIVLWETYKNKIEN